MHRFMDLTRGGFFRLGATGVATAAGGDARRRRGARCAAAGHAAGRRRRLPDLRGRGRAHRAGLLPAGADDARALRRRRAPAPGAGARRPSASTSAGSTRRSARTPSAPGDYEVDFPKSAFATPRPAPWRSASSLEKLLVGVYVNGAGYAADPGTRLLVARLLTVDGQLLGSAARDDRQGRSADGLPNPLEHRAGGRRPRQAHHRSRLAGRSADHASHDARRRPRVGRRAAGAGRGAGAQRLRRHVADQRLPGASTRARRYSFGGSNTLQLQIERGAPADVFASASPNEAQALFREGLCTRPVTFAINRLVLLDPQRQPGQRHLGLLAALRRAQAVDRDRRRAHRRLHAPAAAAHAAVVDPELQHASASRPTSARSPPRSRSGSADAGFVYFTDGLAVKDRTKMISLPKWAQPPVRYQICTVKRAGRRHGRRRRPSSRR